MRESKIIGKQMKHCRTCKHFAQSIVVEPCISCIDESNWQSDDHIAELIEAAERRAFEAGWGKAIDLYEAGELRGYNEDDFKRFKEESK